MQVPTFGPAHATAAGDTDFVVASTVVPADDNLFGSVSECFESDDSGGSISWTEELRMKAWIILQH